MTLSPCVGKGWRLLPPGTTTVELLAKKIDELESHVDQYGSVVAKIPDVWGEERLTFHRFEYEQEMAKQLNKFVGTINAQVRRSDQAFLASAISMEALLNGGSNVSARATSLFGAEVNNQIDRTNAVSGTSEFAKVLVNNEAGGDASATVSLEPTQVLDQMSRYLQHLHELRRINEGDDTRGLPGYSMNLLRIPVSVMPGKKTREGYGAEITLSLSPQIGDRMLPDVFREWVINDIVYQLGLPLTDMLNASPPLNDKGKPIEKLSLEKFVLETLEEFEAEEEAENEFRREKGDVRETNYFSWGNSSWWFDPYFPNENAPEPTLPEEAPERILDFSPVGSEPQSSVVESDSRSTPQPTLSQTEKVEPKTDPNSYFWYRLAMKLKDKNLLDDADKDKAQQAQDGVAQAQSRQVIAGAGSELAKMISNYAASLNPQPGSITESIKSRIMAGAQTAGSFAQAWNDDSARQLIKIVEVVTTKVWTSAEKTNIRLGRANARNVQLPFPLSQFSTIYGQSILFHVGADAQYRIPKSPGTELRSVTDISAYLREEVSAAYTMLSREENLHLWDACNRQLSLAIRNYDREAIQAIRINFFESLRATGGAYNKPTGAFAWAIIVEAALLNEQMIRDMRSTASAKGCDCLPTEWAPFYLPEPPMHAISAFNQYVKCRWPIHVFHVDPMVQDQNVGDSFSQRRELQLAMAIAVASGQVGVDQVTNYARRVELDMETIALNRTIVGFSHGEDTFGWRFGPRVQTPEIESNFKVAFRDLLLGGPKRDALLANHRIEPGSRECVALVIAPSFLRQFIVDVHSDWQKLTNTRSTKPSTTKAVQMSHEIRELRNLANQCSLDAHEYRDGEVYRLLRRVDQLSKELPMQTMRVELPVANRLGGFRLMVPGGANDRSPQLYSWHGAPGINLEGETTLFLTGENFSLHGTRVIAGSHQISSDQIVPATQTAEDEIVTSKPEASQAATEQVSEGEPTAQKTAATPTPAGEPRVRILNDSQLEIRIPKGARTITERLPDGRLQKFVEIQVATYYGVSQYLRVPVSASVDTTDETQKLVEAAVKKHADSQHVVRFDWKAAPKDARANAILDTMAFAKLSLERATALQSLKLENKSTFPTTLLKIQGPPEVAFFAEFTSNNKQQKAVKESIGPYLLAKDSLPLSTIEADLTKELQKLPGDFELKEITLVGFVRFPDNAQRDNLPVYPMATEIKIAVTRLTTNAGKAAGTAFESAAEPTAGRFESTLIRQAFSSNNMNRLPPVAAGEVTPVRHQATSQSPVTKTSHLDSGFLPLQRTSRTSR